MSSFINVIINFLLDRLSIIENNLGLILLSVVIGILLGSRSQIWIYKERTEVWNKQLDSKNDDTKRLEEEIENLGKQLNSKNNTIKYLENKVTDLENQLQKKTTRTQLQPRFRPPNIPKVEF
jgi:uncharacterized protein YlxW (UPF0749 family)